MRQAQLWVTHCSQQFAGHAAHHHVCSGDGSLYLPLGSLARKNGRKAAFMVGTGAGVITGLTAALAVFIGSFLLFCIAAFMGGAYAAVALSFRFAATDGVTPERRARALSLVMGEE
jgi:MFS family permease